MPIVMPGIVAAQQQLVSPDLEFVAATVASSGNALALSIAKPTGVIAGDLLVALVGIGSDHIDGSGAATRPANTGALFTQLVPGAGVGSGTFDWAMQHWADYRLAGGSEPATYEWTWTGAANLIPNFALLAFRNPDPVTPIVTHTTDTTINADTLDLPSITTVKDKSILVMGFTLRTICTGRTITSQPSDYQAVSINHQCGGASNRASNRLGAGWKAVPTAGPTGLQSFTFGGTITSPGQAGVMLAINPK